MRKVCLKSYIQEDGHDRKIGTAVTKKKTEIPTERMKVEVTVYLHREWNSEYHNKVTAALDRIGKYIASKGI